MLRPRLQAAFACVIICGAAFALGLLANNVPPVTALVAGALITIISGSFVVLVYAARAGMNRSQ